MSLLGSQTTKTTRKEQVKNEIGSTVGSIAGNVNITAGNNVTSEGTTIVSGKDISLTGKEVTLDNSVDTYDSQYKYEFKQSGLSVSLGGGVVDAGSDLAKSLNRAGDVQDDRLKALYVYKATEDLKAIGKDLKQDPNGGVSINVGIGSTKLTQEQTTHVETVNMSNINAGGDVTIKATEGNVNLKATNINATDVTIDAKKDINIEADQNKQQTNTKTNSSSSSIGASFGLSGSFGGFTGSASSSKGKEKEDISTHAESVINASGTTTLKSGNDTNIIGSQVKGEKVVADVGGNLNIASQQDTDNYTEKNKSSGVSFITGDKNGKDSIINKADKVNTSDNGVIGSTNKEKINSTYSSVVDQAGIYAGKDGFDIHVGKNTDLKGAVISSEATPDKNKISTDTLTWMDLHNKAKYSASSSGSSTPSIPVSGKADSTTKSAISPGTIDVRSGNTDISKLSRNTDQALNALGKIFDKKTVKEKQELVNLFSQEANKAIGDLAESMRDKASTPEEKAKWGEGGEYKALLHAVAAGITSSLSGNGFASGAAGDGISQLAQKQLANITDKNLRLIASAIVGAAAAKVVGGNAQVGAIAAYIGVKYNDYNHRTHREGEIVHTKDGFFMVINGVDTAIAPPPEGVYFWEQDANNSDYGWDYQKGNGISSVDTYFPGVVQSQTILFEINGKAIGIAITDDTDAQKKESILAKAREWASGVIALGSGYSGGSLAGGIETGVKTAEEVAVATKVTQIDNLVNDIGGSIKANPLRQEYENAVTFLKNTETKLRNQGLSEESIARTLYQERRDLGVTYKDATPTELRQYIYEVNANRYGDPLGPSFESLVEKYNGDYSKIIEAAQRPNPDVDSLLGGFREWLLKKSGL